MSLNIKDPARLGAKSRQGSRDTVTQAVTEAIRERLERVRRAYADFGRGRHPAGLNFGACFA